MRSCAGGGRAATRRPMPPADRALPLRHAVALGLLQGPAELLPISSSAHTTLIPWLAGWPYARLDGRAAQVLRGRAPRRRGRRARAPHAPAAAARRRARGPAPGRRDRARARAAGARRLRARTRDRATARRTALDRRGTHCWRCGDGARRRRDGRADGSAAADDNGHVRHGSDGGRIQEDATARDGLALGLAQAAALIPGVSRNGATLTAARARGFARADAQALSWHAGLPVILGASLLEGARCGAAAFPASSAQRSRSAASARSPPRWRARGCWIARCARAVPCGRTRSTAACSPRRRPPPSPRGRRARTMDAMTPIGTLIGGRYRLDAEIGRGGMSTVYRAFDTVLERPVAIKLMHREIAADSDQLERFRREARSVAQLNHPHVVTVIDAGEERVRRRAARRRGHGHAVHRARVRRRRDAQGRHPPRGPARDPAGARLRDRDRARARRRPRAPDRPPRRQAPERPDQRGRRRQDHRLRDRALAHRGGPDDGRARARHDRLRLARAGARTAGHGPVRPLLARRRAVRDAHRARCPSTAARRWRSR